MSDGTLRLSVQSDEPKIDVMGIESGLLTHFSQVRLLQTGNGASVWKVEREQAQWAAKVFEPQRVSAYRREVAVALHVRSQHIVPCTDTLILSGGHNALVYEWMPGGSVNQLISHSRLHDHLAAQVLEQALMGLADLHRHDYVHCDIKPSNILCSKAASNGSMQFYLADLGSVATAKEAKAGHHTNGSPAYCAPERLHGGFDLSSDIYSIGILAFELLCGHLPYVGSVEDIYRAHLSRPLPLQDIRSTAWREWIARACAKRAQDRFASAAQALAVLPVAVHREAAPTQTQAGVAHSTATPGQTSANIQAPLSLHASPARPSLGATSPLPSLQLGEEPEQMTLLSDAAILGLSNGIWFWTPTMAQAQPITAAQAPFFLHADGVAFCSEGQLCVVDPWSRKRAALLALDLGEPAIALASHSNYVALAQARRVMVMDMQRNTVICAIRHRHYALQPALDVDASSFVLSGGLANQEIWWRNFAGDSILHWRTQGTVLELRLAAGSCYASVADARSQGVTVWRFTPSQNPLAAVQLSTSIASHLGRGACVGFDGAQQVLRHYAYEALELPSPRGLQAPAPSRVVALSLSEQDATRGLALCQESYRGQTQVWLRHIQFSPSRTEALSPT